MRDSHIGAPTRVRRFLSWFRVDVVVALADGALAFALLVGLQFVVTWSSVRARQVRQLVAGEPLMLHRGDLLPSALRQARVTQDEIRAAVRAARLSSGVRPRVQFRHQTLGRMGKR